MGFFKNCLLLSVYTKRLYSIKAQNKVMKYLNVAEKNDAAKNIAAILSRGNSNRREGLSPYNKIYEFDAQVLGENCKMVMTSVSGHLMNYEFASMYRSWQSVNPAVLFDAPVIKACSADNSEKIKKTLEREVRSCQGLIIWTDCDREGENIGFEIIKVCTDIKPNLRVYRAKFSEITGASVFRALNTLGQPNKNVSDSVDVRQELDLRTGAAFTRLQTLRLQKVFPQKLAEKLISYGSCQFPTLGFVVERYQAIEDFISEPFWRIKMNHTVKELTTDFQWKRDRLFDKNSCEAILDHCKENPSAKVESVESKPKSKWRPLPLDTVEMEKTISRKLRINAKETMKIAEKLYTQGFISYPRTETNIFPKELNLTNMVEQQQNDGQWGPFARRIMTEGGPTPRQGKKSDQAHPPIHPTKYADNLQGNDKRVYEYIVRHFLACVHKDAQGFETIVNVDVAGEKFTAKGLVILEKNYLDVYTYEKWNAKEINHYEQGDTFMPSVLEMTESQTAPPKLLTEADLIALMEKYGIGTDATHADHIDTIKSREYVGLNDIYFVPGTLGMGLVEGYNNIGLEVSLAKPTLRAEFENDLKLICDGLKDPEVVRREQIAKYKAVFQTVAEKMRLIDNSLANRLDDRPEEPPPDNVAAGGNEFRPALKCPKCGSDMVVRTKKDGSTKFITCTGFPACKNIIWFSNVVKTIEVTDQSCQECGPNYKLLKFTFRPNPFPGEPNPNTLCIGGCDENINEGLSINLSSVRQVNNQGNNSIQPQRNNSVNTRNLGQNSTQGNPRNRNRDNLQNTNQFGSSSSYSQSNFGNNPGFNKRNSSIGSNSIENTATNTSNRNSLVNMPGPSGHTRLGSRSSSDNRSSNKNDIVCQCDQQSVLLTVKKDGANKGRQFYKCAGNNCSFFLWDPDDPNFQQTSQNLNDNDEIKCKCNQKAPLRTVNKDGPNKGRQFYCCPNMTNGCGFFKWADETDNGGNLGGNDDDDSDNPYVNDNDEIKCKCNKKAPLRTANKDGRKKGRQFYCCPNIVNGCGFFKWVDEAETGGNRGGDDDDGPDYPSFRQTANQNFNDNNDIQCKCNQKAPLRTVNKDGPNKGRQFYCCPNMVNGCGFFKWADEADDDDDNNGGGGWGRGGTNLNYSFRGRSSRGRGKRGSTRSTPYPKNSGGTSTTRAKRKCGRCGTEGHTKNNCPN